jgi:hypothetical protein
MGPLCLEVVPDVAAARTVASETTPSGKEAREMSYEVRVVEDCELPAGVAWACVNTGGDKFMFVKRSLGADQSALSLLVESVTGLPCPCKRGVACPLSPQPVPLAV